MMDLARPVYQSGDDDRRERERVRGVYEQYRNDPHYAKIWSPSPASDFISRCKWRAIVQLLGGRGFDLKSARVLDLGAGLGEDCAQFERLGAPKAGVVALDLVERRIRAARGLHPWLAAVVGDTFQLPFKDGAFDLVYQSMMLSSVLDARRRAGILAEVRRVMSPRGLFLSYDMRYPNPWNPHTSPLGPREIASAFPGWSLTVRSVTAIPQLLRFLAPWSLTACRVVEGFPVLRSHLLAMAWRP